MGYDDIVIGAGSAGAVLAARLSEDPDRSVLLLEAGPDYRTVEETPNDLLRSSISFGGHDWGWCAQATPQREIEFWQGKVVGGCSAIGASVALRGMPADFNEWAAMGNDQWHFDKVLPFYRKLEHDVDFADTSHGKDGPIWIERPKRSSWHPLVSAFYDSCRSLGFADASDLNDQQATGVGPCPRNLRGGIRISTAIGYLASARSRLNLAIRGGCLADRILIENGRAVGVEAVTAGGIHRVYGKRVTLSAGALASPAILMRSGVGRCADLDRHGIRTLVDAPGVGANLIDHPMVMLFAMLTRNFILRYPGEDHSRASALLRYTASDSKEFNDMQFRLMPILDWNLLPGFPVAPGTPPMLLGTPCLQRPRSRGRVTLRSTDPGDQPNIDLRYFTDPEDLRRMVDGMRLGWRIANQSDVAAGWQAPIVGLSGQILDQETVDSDSAIANFVMQNCASNCHAAGTARMGPDFDKDAVVDQFCRVRGVEGLRVVDASVMPNIVRADTNLTCMMIGERAATWMRAED